MFYIGLSLEKDAFRVAILKDEKKSVAIESLHTFPYGPDNVKLFYNLPPFHTGKQIHIASGLASSNIFIRKLHIPLNDKRKILAALPFQLESLIPFANENPLICPLFKRLSKQMTSVTVIASAQSSFFAHLDALKELDIASDTVSCAPIALMRFAHWKFPSAKKILCFDVRDGKVSCIISEEGELLLSQTLATCDKENIPVELEKLAVFIKQKGVLIEDTPWVLTGDLSLAEHFARAFNGPQLELANEPLAPFAVPIGLALDAFKSDDSSVQFCRREFTPPHTLQSRKKKILSYLAICAASAALMAGFGSFILAKKQDILVDRLESYLPASLSNAPLSSIQEIQEKLSQWESSSRKQKSAFAFIPDVPKVSDVLAWLSAHPAFATEDGGQKEGIEIKTLHYTLNKYPKIGEPSSPYMAHVELEFTSATPRAARDFHEALLKGDRIVNAKKDIKWQAQNQTYHTAFDLNKGAGP